MLTNRPLSLCLCQDSLLLWYSFSAAELLQVFPGKTWAYRCATCRRCLLKPTADMAEWREGAQRKAVGTLAWKVASLPVAQCRRGVCDPCVFKNKWLARSAARAAVAAPPLQSSATVDSSAGQAVAGGQSAPPHVPSPLVAQAVPVNAQGASFFDLVGGGAVSGAQRERGLPALSSGSPVWTSQCQPSMQVVQHSASLNALPLSPPAVTCKDFTEALRAGALDGERDKVILERISSNVLLRGSPNQLRLTRDNGTTACYVRQARLRKAKVAKSQSNRRRAAARRQLLTTCPGAELAADPSGGAEDGAPGRLPAGNSRAFLLGRAIPSAEEQVGLLEVAGISQRGFALVRRVFWGGRVGMASVAELRKARQRMEALPAKQITVDGAGAHIANLSLAVQERVSALCKAGCFVERHVYDDAYRAIAKTVLFSDAAASDKSVLAGCPPMDMKDVHLTVGLDKGGSPASVKIVVGIINQAHPNNPNNTILAAVCPCEKDNYDDLDAMLKTLAPQVKALLTGGLLVVRERRAVRLLPNGDYDALCTLLGHKGASATMPCLVCLSTRSPSREHHALDCKYLTLQDVTGTRTLRSEQQYVGGGQAGQSVVGDATGTPFERQVAHMSVELAPLLPAVPQKIVPIPLHITLGINSRLLSLATECVIRCK